jgi:hypothetical protein
MGNSPKNEQSEIMFPLTEIWPKRKLEIIASIVVLSAIVAMLIYTHRNRPLREELEKEVRLMHPSVQKRFRDFIREVEKKTGYRVEIASAWRGWARSVRIWETVPEVRLCCPPGNDYHFFGLAADLVLHGPNGERLGLASSRADWENTGIVEIARKYKLQWGGTKGFGYWDPVHFAYPLWYIKDPTGTKETLVQRAIKNYGSLQNAEGNRIDTTGLPKREWQTA